MVQWYVDKGLGTLIAQLKEAYPGIVIGTIGDSSHKTENPSSDHNPEADGSVDAIDPMIGPMYTTLDAQRDVNTLVSSRDNRIAYIIWNRRIVSNHKVGGYDAWEWRPYTGTTDPHTGHWHLSVNDNHENDTRKWKIYEKDDDMNVNEFLAALETDRAQNALEDSAGKGVHNQKLGRSTITIGEVLQGLAADFADLTARLKRIEEKIDTHTGA